MLGVPRPINTNHSPSPLTTPPPPRRESKAFTMFRYFRHLAAKNNHPSEIVCCFHLKKYFANSYVRHNSLSYEIL